MNLRLRGSDNVCIQTQSAWRLGNSEIVPLLQAASVPKRVSASSGEKGYAPLSLRRCFDRPRSRLRLSNVPIGFLPLHRPHALLRESTAVAKRWERNEITLLATTNELATVCVGVCRSVPWHLRRSLGRMHRVGRRRTFRTWFNTTQRVAAISPANLNESSLPQFAMSNRASTD